MNKIQIGLQDDKGFYAFVKYDVSPSVTASKDDPVLKGLVDEAIKSFGSDPVRIIASIMIVFKSPQSEEDGKYIR